MITNLLIQIYFLVPLATLDMKTETKRAQAICQAAFPKASITSADIDTMAGSDVRLSFTCQEN